MEYVSVFNKLSLLFQKGSLRNLGIQFGVLYSTGRSTIDQPLTLYHTLMPYLPASSNTPKVGCFKVVGPKNH